MTEDARKLPKNTNVKVFMRHSKRFENPVNGDYSKLLLTPEGVELANRIGRSLNVPIGYIYSSPVKRCIQTASEIAKGAGIEEPCVEIVQGFADLIGIRHAQDDLGIGWFEYYYGLQRNLPEHTGGAVLRDVALPIIDTIFSLPASDNSFDIMCSHDSHVAVLASALFDFKSGIHGENWCEYAEGLFIYGTRNDFTALWRGRQRRFINW